jgi:hypothetical protein
MSAHNQGQPFRRLVPIYDLNLAEALREKSRKTKADGAKGVERGFGR